MLSLFKNDLKQLKNYVVIYTGCLILNFIINVLSYSDELPILTFYFIAFIFSLILPLIYLMLLNRPILTLCLFHIFKVL